MKKMKFFAMALAALTIASCSKEDVIKDKEQTPVVEGVETFATFAFDVEGSGSKSKAGSETDEGKTAKEAAVKDIRIIIFKSGTPSTLEVNTVTDITDVNLVTTPTKLTSGKKRIFVFANTKNDAQLSGLALGAKLEDCYSLLITTPSPFSLASLVGDANGYYMSNARTKSSLQILHPNISAADSKVGDATKNHFTFEVQRAVAKVKAKLFDADVVKVMGGTTAKPVILGTLSNMQYTARNVNKSIRPVQLFAETDIEDAAAKEQTTLPLAPYYNSFDGKDEAFMKNIANFGDYDRSYLIDQTLTATEATKSVFVTENTNARPVFGNTTYLAISGKYTPEEVVGECEYDSELNGGTFGPKTGTLGTDFYKVDLSKLGKTGKPGEGLQNNLFDTYEHAKTLLDAVLLANGISESIDNVIYDKAIADYILKYKDGLTYYRLNIGVTTKKDSEEKITTFGIKRNSVYSVVINKINKLGANDEGDLNKDPETPVTSQETYVTATIKVLDWVQMGQEGEL